MALPTVYEFKYKPSNTTGDKVSFLLGTSASASGSGSLNFYLHNHFDYADTNLSFKGNEVTWNSYTQLLLKSEKDDEKKASIEIKGSESSITISADTTTIGSITVSADTTTVDGNIISATAPTEATHLTNKEYVDTEKVSINSGIMDLEDIKGSENLPSEVKAWNEYDTFIYAYSPKAEKTKGQEDLRFPDGPKWIRLSQEWDPQHEDSTGSLTAVQRTSAGTILAADPIYEHDVATKKYTDNKSKLYRHVITLKLKDANVYDIFKEKKGTISLCFCFTSKKGTKIVDETNKWIDEKCAREVGIYTKKLPASGFGFALSDSGSMSVLFNVREVLVTSHNSNGWQGLTIYGIKWATIPVGYEIGEEYFIWTNNITGKDNIAITEEVSEII